MPPVVVFLALLIGPIVVAKMRHAPVLAAFVNGAGFAVAVSLVAYGDQLALPYVVKGLLIAFGAGLWVWTFDNVTRRDTSDSDAAPV